MNPKKIMGIAIIALILAISAIGQSGISSAINLIAGNNINISIDGDNYTISANNISSGSDNTKVNKSGDVMTGILDFDSNDVYNLSYLFSSNPVRWNVIGQFELDTVDGYNSTSMIFNENYIALASENDSNFNSMYIYPDRTELIQNLDMKGNNITNCGNCYGMDGTNGTNGLNGTNGINGTNGVDGINGTNGINQSDNTKVNKSGDTMIGDLNINGNITLLNNSTLILSPYPFSVGLYSYYIDNGLYSLTDTSDQNSVWWTLLSNVPTTSTISIIQINNTATCASCGIRVALYSGNESMPISLLNESSSIIAVQGINNISIPTTIVYSNIRYWGAYQTNNSVTGIKYKIVSSVKARRTAYGYTTFPSIPTADNTTLSLEIKAIAVNTASKSYACFEINGSIFASLTPCL